MSFLNSSLKPKSSCEEIPYVEHFQDNRAPVSPSSLTVSTVAFTRLNDLNDFQVQNNSSAWLNPQRSNQVPFLDACKTGSMSTLCKLINADPSLIASKNIHGNNALHIACEIGDVQKACALFQLGVSIFEPNNQGETPLHIAIKNSNFALIEAISAVQNGDGFTPVHYACANQDIKSLKALLNSAKLNLDLQTATNGDTPLHLACLTGSKDIIALVLTRKCDLTLKNHQNELASDILTKLHPQLAQKLGWNQPVVVSPKPNLKEIYSSEFANSLANNLQIDVQAVKKALAQENGNQVIQLLKADPFLKASFELHPTAGTPSNFLTIEAHTTAVLNEFSANFNNPPNKYQIENGDSLSKADFRLFLILHDIGKGWSEKEGKAQGWDQKIKKEKELAYTQAILKKTLDKLDYSSKKIEIMSAFLDEDTLGSYFKGELDLNTATSQIVEMAKHANLPPLGFLGLFEAYYRADAGAYPFLQSYLFEPKLASATVERLYKPFYGDKLDKLKKAL